MRGVPQGWAEVSFADVTEARSGNSKLIKGKLLSSPTQHTYPAYSASGQDVWHTAYEYDGDAVIVSAVGARCGKAFFASGKWSAIANTHIVRPTTAIYPRFLYLLLNNEDFWEKGGSAQPFVKVSATLSKTLQLPPLPEQRRIVAKIDSLTGKSRRARDHLDHIPRLVEKYKQAVLAAAFRGLHNAKRVRLKELTTKIGSGATPRGGSKVYVSSGVPFIRSQNVYFEGFTRQGLVSIDDTAARALSGVTVKVDDLLLNITGASIGRACIVPDALVGARVNQHVAIIRCKPDLDPRFLMLFLWSPDVQDWVMNENYGVTRQALTKNMLEALQVPQCGLPEQHSLIASIEKAFARIDRLAAEATSARRLIDHLDQAVLAKAFCGELVPQDPDDEPASVLLERIRAERAPAPKTKRGRKASVG